MNELICHLIGDYILQSDWMALKKTQSKFAAAVHAVSYGVPFMMFARVSPAALVVIIGTHFVIDHWRLARYICWIKNWAAPASWWQRWERCKKTGYPEDRPEWMTVWLMIIADNTLHLLINHLALRWWP